VYMFGGMEPSGNL
jgi:hypothetical protein